MSSAKTNSVPTPESVHDVWLSQRVELERDLFDGWAPEVRTVSPVVRPEPVEKVVRVLASDAAPQRSEASDVANEPAPEEVEAVKTKHREWLKQSNAAVIQQRAEHQQNAVETLSQQREAFLQDLARQRAVFEQEFSARETSWSEQRDQEWAALRTAKEIHEVAQQRLKDDLSAQRVREREELLQWRRQAEAELAEARRLFEQERLKQQQEFAKHREAEMSRLRREREELDARVRQVHSELAYARQRQEDELRQARDVQSAQMRAERAELDKLRDTWLEKFRREQVVLENELQFFGQHLSRVSEELQVGQRGLQAVSESATEANPTVMIAEAQSTTSNARPVESTVLSLEEIRERLAAIRQPRRAAG